MEIESKEAKTQVQNPEAESIEEQIQSKFDQYIKDIGGQELSQENPEMKEKPIEEKPAEESPEEEKPMQMDGFLKEAKLDQLKESLLTEGVDDGRFKEEQIMNEELVEQVEPPPLEHKRTSFLGAHYPDYQNKDLEHSMFLFYEDKTLLNVKVVDQFQDDIPIDLLLNRIAARQKVISVDPKEPLFQQTEESLIKHLKKHSMLHQVVMKAYKAQPVSLNELIFRIETPEQDELCARCSIKEPENPELQLAPSYASLRYETQLLKVLNNSDCVPEVREEIIQYSPDTQEIVGLTAIFEQSHKSLEDLVRLWNDSILSEEYREWFTMEKLTYYFFQILSAVDFLHQKDVYYGDIKASDVMIFRNQKVKLRGIGKIVKLQHQKEPDSTEAKKLMTETDHLSLIALLKSVSKKVKSLVTDTSALYYMEMLEDLQSTSLVKTVSKWTKFFAERVQFLIALSDQLLLEEKPQAVSYIFRFSQYRDILNAIDKLGGLEYPQYDRYVNCLVDEHQEFLHAPPLSIEADQQVGMSDKNWKEVVIQILTALNKQKQSSLIQIYDEVTKEAFEQLPLGFSLGNVTSLRDEELQVIIEQYPDDFLMYITKLKYTTVFQDVWIKLERVIEKSRQDPLLLVCLAHMARYCCKYKSPEVWEVCQHLKLSEKGMQLAQKTGEKKYFVIFLMTAAKSRYLQEDLEQAEVYIEEAKYIASESTYDRQLGPFTITFAKLLKLYSVIKHKKEQNEKAFELIDRSLRIFKTLRGETHPQTMKLCQKTAKILYKMKDPKALIYLKKYALYDKRAQLQYIQFAFELRQVEQLSQVLLDYEFYKPTGLLINQAFREILINYFGRPCKQPEQDRVIGILSLKEHPELYNQALSQDDLLYRAALVFCDERFILEEKKARCQDQGLRRIILFKALKFWAKKK